MNGIPQGSILGPILINIFINNIGSRIECTRRKFADDTNMRGAVDVQEGWDVTHRDLDRLEEWTSANLTKTEKTKCNVLHLGWGDPQHQHRLKNKWIESSPAEKDLGVLVGGKLDMSWQCALAAPEAKCNWAASKQMWPAS